MKIAILKERDAHEPRVSATPESVKKLLQLGAEVVVEMGAGERSHFADSEYLAMGAEIEPDPVKLIANADVVFCVRRPMPELVMHMARGTMVVGMLAPYVDSHEFEAYAVQGVDAFAMELMPRISRAQSMDVLSSQANLAGYKAVIDAVAEFHRAVPLMMTSAGTVPAAKVFVLGAGVAGLQAIATAHRLGAVVSATDVRAAAKEQVESLGGEFVMVDSHEAEAAEASSGYAKEMSEDYKRRQAKLVADTLAQQDIVICTALIPGRPAPELVSVEMVESMKPGSVIVDLAVEQGGNCPLSRPGVIVDHQGVKIMGYRNVPARIPVDASSMYARNLVNFIVPFVHDGKLDIDWDDQLVVGTALTRNSEVIHPCLLDIKTKIAVGA